MADAIQDRGGTAPSITPARTPQRLQRSRKRGHRTPPGVIYVGRPTVFNNPFDGKRFGHARSVLLYRRWIARDLQCWCPVTSRWCHADVLLSAAQGAQV